ncbi:MAG: hypothetical protein WC998_01290 [Candidatus Paceibacterota bacterium]|jgi:hypothetical protein
MAKLENDKLGLSFTFPDKPTVYQILVFDSKLNEMIGKPTFLKLWETAKTIISDWQCESFPDYKVALDTIQGEDTDMNKIARIVEYVGSHAITWRTELDLVSKN